MNMYRIILILLFLSFLIDYACSSKCGYSSSVERYSKILNASVDDKIVKRMVAGDDALEGDWPWVVSFRKRFEGHHCTGSILSKRWILTAAHCCTDHVLLRQVTGSTHKYRGRRYNIYEMIKHPEYNYPKTGSLNHDVCLLRVNRDILFNNRTQPICIQRDVILKEGELVVGIGWGRVFDYFKTLEPDTNTEDNTVYHRPKILQELPMMIHREEDGEEFYKTRIRVGGMNSGPGIGDSGGPLMALRDNRWVHVGISSSSGDTSIENSRIDMKSTASYIRSSYYCDWIEEATNYEVKCQ